MDKKTKYLFLVFVSIISLVIVISFCRYYIDKDYYIVIETSCDHFTESCFVYVCDPESSEDCPEIPEERTSYYKLIKIKASNIPFCDKNENECPAITCVDGQDCVDILCDPENIGEEEVCSLPQETKDAASGILE